METAREFLEEMPFDHGFYTVEGNYELCHATGWCVCLGDTQNSADWWNEYTDSEGNLYYGR